MTKTKNHPTKPKGNAQPPSKRGNKPSITPEKRSVFLAAIENGLKVKEALVQANIHVSSYQRLKDKSAEFRTEIEVAEMKLTMAARSKLAQAIQNADMPTVRWYLERKVPDEFRPQFGDDGQPAGLPPGTVIILPGSKPHPRIVPEGESK